MWKAGTGTQVKLCKGSHVCNYCTSIVRLNRTWNALFSVKAATLDLLIWEALMVANKICSGQAYTELHSPCSYGMNSSLTETTLVLSTSFLSVETI